MSHPVEIGERHQDEHPSRVFIKAPVTDLGEAPQSFDHVKGMLDEGADRGPAPGRADSPAYRHTRWARLMLRSRSTPAATAWNSRSRGASRPGMRWR